MRGKRLACSQVDVLRQQHGKILFGNGHDAAFRAVDGGNGVTPIALARNEPVTQAEFHFALAAARLFQRGHDGGLAFGMLATAHARVRAALHERALGIHSLFPRNLGDNAVLLARQLFHERVIVAQDDGDDGQVVLTCEFEVTLVAAGNGHDSARAVIGHYVVGNPNGHLLAVDGVHHVTASELAMLFVIALGALHGGYLLRGFH